MESSVPLQPKVIVENVAHYSLRECKNQIFATVIVTIGSFGTGTVFGWSATATEDLQHRTEFGTISKEKEIAWVTSLAILGAFLAGPMAGYLMDTVGRKIAIIVFSFPFVVGWLTMCSAHFFQQFFLLYIGRFLTGICAGANLVIIPTYIKEIAVDSLRGILGTMMPLQLVNGILFTFIIGSYFHWAVLTACCGAIPTILLVCICLCSIPETPRYLLVKNQKSKAVASFKWLYGIPTNDIAEEKLTVMYSAEIDVNQIHSKGKKDWKKFLSRPVFKPVIIVVFVMLFQQFGGVNAVTLYTVEIFRLAGADFIQPHTATIILGVFQVVFVIASMFLVDLLGRKTLLTFCSLVMGCGLVGLGTFFLLKERGDGSEKSFVWLPVASTWTYIAAYSCGVGPVPWVLASEIYNPDYRAESATIMTSAYWIFGFIVAQTYENLKGWLSASGSFYFYGGFCLAGATFAALFVPETKGKSTEAIVKYFGGRVDTMKYDISDSFQNDGAGDMSDSSDPPTMMTPTSENNSHSLFYPRSDVVAGTKEANDSNKIENV